jgi:hypothetical protein
LTWGFTAADVRRVIWSFVGGVIAYAIGQASGWLGGSASAGRRCSSGAIAAGVAAVKNGLLSDSSRLK